MICKKIQCWADPTLFIFLAVTFYSTNSEKVDFWEWNTILKKFIETRWKIYFKFRSGHLQMKVCRKHFTRPSRELQECRIDDRSRIWNFLFMPVYWYFKYTTCPIFGNVIMFRKHFSNSYEDDCIYKLKWSCIL